jgi:hypothetical protein
MTSDFSGLYVDRPPRPDLELGVPFHEILQSMYADRIQSVRDSRILRSRQRATNPNPTRAPSCRVSGSPNFDGENVG